MSNFLANVDHFHSLINGGTFKRTGKHEFINEREREGQIGSVRASPKFIRGIRLPCFPRELRAGLSRAN